VTTATADKTRAASPTASWTIKDLVALTKPSVTRLVVFTGLVGVHVAPGPIPFWPALWMLVGCVLLVASANVLNCYLERDGDRLMARTASRPLPSGRMDARSALRWGLALQVISLPVLWLGANPLTAVLGVMAHAGYVLVYTPMKRTSMWATVIGGVPGAMPPLMGWTAVTGRLELGAFMLFLVVFVWQLPHTLAIGLFRKEEYAHAGIRVIPLVAGTRKAQLAVFFTTVPLLPVSMSFYWLDIAGPLYLIAAGVLGAVFTGLAAGGLSKNANARWARTVFFFSMAYLTFICAALSLDVLVR